MVHRRLDRLEKIFSADLVHHCFVVCCAAMGLFVAKFFGIRNGLCVGKLIAARNIIQFFCNDVVVGLHSKYIIYDVTVRVKGAFQRSIRRVTKVDSSVACRRCKIRLKKRNRHMAALSGTFLLLKVVLNVNIKLRMEIGSAGSNVLLCICTCMSLDGFAMRSAT